MKQTIAFAGGWSWGHIFPISSLIKTLDKWKYNVLWFWTKNSLEEKIANDLKKQWYDLVFLPILAGKIRRQKDLKSSFQNIIDLFKICWGFFQSFFYILKYKPKFVFSKWGFVAFNPSLAWKILWKKVYLHESDTIPGLVNKIVWKFANKVFLWFDSAKKYFSDDKTMVVWQILDDIFVTGWQDWDRIIKMNSEKWIVENDNKKTNLLVMWWSQWAKVINLAIKNLLDKWELRDFNIFVVWWLLNKRNIFEKFDNVKFYEFLDQKELVKLYQKADVCVTRGSATSLAEQDQFDIKKIIVPLPYTWWNHQYYNALEYEKKWDILLSQLDKGFEKKLGEILKKIAWYKKKKWQYRKNFDAKKIILEEIL